MVSPLTSSTGTPSATETDPSSALASASNSNAMGKDAFMKLLVAQISHQNPLKPMDDTAFVAQLAQFSALEQTMGINKRLDELTTAQRGSANTELGALVGKRVTVRGTMTSLDSSGIGAPISYTLDGNAKTVDVNIADATGKVVRTIHVGAQPAGLTKITWDGRNNDGLAQPPGPYTISVVAKDGANAVSVSQETTGTLVGIDFSKGYPNLQLDNGVSAPASDLLRINLATK
ncbi:MAG TPA: flagellar hook assembly protein FlgD [Polyangiaceae bacterium]|nr:flagellar hook assembly protein FlgD [Polyangiaceae bacterium]